MKDEWAAAGDLRARTRQFGVRVIRLTSSMPSSAAGRVLGMQLLRAGTSVGANYREACRSRSDAELVSKLETSLQELDETAYWLELIVESGTMPAKRLEPLRDEANQLIAIFVTCVKKVKARKRQ